MNKLLVNGDLFVSAIQALKPALPKTFCGEEFEFFYFRYAPEHRGVTANHSCEVEVTAFRDDFELTVSLPMEVRDPLAPFEFALATEVVGELSNFRGQLLVISDHGDVVEISTGEDRYTFEGRKSRFPKMLVDVINHNLESSQLNLFVGGKEGIIEFSLPEGFHKQLKRLSPAICNETIRWSMCGLRMVSKEDSFQLAATNGHVLKLVNLPAVGPNKFGITIPRPVVDILSGLRFTRVNSQVVTSQCRLDVIREANPSLPSFTVFSISYDNYEVKGLRSVTLRCKTISEPFPDYSFLESISDPEASDTTNRVSVRLDQAVLLNAISKAKSLAKQAHHVCLRLDGKKGDVLEFCDEILGDTYTVKLNYGAVSGVPGSLMISLPVKHLKSLLLHEDQDELILHIPSLSSKTPVYFSCCDAINFINPAQHEHNMGE
jgi:hypothetical protein